MVYTDVGEFCRVCFRPQRRQFVIDKHKKYIKAGVGFDIETTRNKDRAFMYVWQVSFNDDICYCRTWYAFEIFMQRLQKFLEGYNARCIIWVANLGHEFAFIGRRFHWDSVFARESHQPIVACTGRIEFREALTISGQGGLKNLAKNYTTTQKAVGDLDYNKPRNQFTPLTEDEIRYIVNDVKILSEWGNYIFSEYSDKKRVIPLTKTGIIRSMIRQAANDTGEYVKIRDAVHSIYPDRETYNLIMLFLFRGGYTHANAWWVCVKWVHVIGADFTSSYPSVMLNPNYYYPKSRFIPLELETDGRCITDRRMQSHCIWFVAIFKGIERTTMHTVESEHKIMKYVNAVFDNGRLVAADSVRVALTEIDYDIYTKFYTWKEIEIQTAFCAVRGRLPEYVLKPLREAYKTKARIKKECRKNGINPDSLPEYRNAKATINSYYGVMVQRLNFDEWIYDEFQGTWEAVKSKKTYNQMIRNAILSPYWGIYVTAHARHNILTIIHEMDPDELSNNVLYSDTDSVYFDNTYDNREIIRKYNQKIEKQNRETLPPEFLDLGQFEWIDSDKDGNPTEYEFKTLGAKRYIKYHDGISEVTVAGMRKGTYEKSMLRTFATDNSFTYYSDMKNQKGKLGYIDKDEFFDTFSDCYILSVSESEKNASIYSPPGEDYSAEITDEYGNTEIMTEKSGVAIVPIQFTIKMDEVYIKLLDQIMKERRRPIWE